MGTLDSSLSKADVETLIEAMGDWETVGNHEFHIMQLIKNLPVPPEDNEAHNYIVDLKEHFKKRGKEINDMRSIRQEKAVFLQAKLMLIRRDLGINELFDNAAATAANPPSEPEVAAAPAVVSEPVVEKVKSDDIDVRLILAEQYIKEVGIWERYQNFLKEQQEQV